MQRSAEGGPGGMRAVTAGEGAFRKNQRASEGMGEPRHGMQQKQPPQLANYQVRV